MKRGMLFGVYDIFFLRIENENCRVRAGLCARHIFTEFGTLLPPPSSCNPTVAGDYAASSVQQIHFLARRTTMQHGPLRTPLCPSILTLQRESSGYSIRYIGSPISGSTADHSWQHSSLLHLVSEYIYKIAFARFEQILPSSIHTWGLQWQKKRKKETTAA